MKSNLFKFWKNFSLHLPNSDISAIVIIIIASIFLFSKNIFIDNAVIFHDETLYKFSADKQIDQSIFYDRYMNLEPVPNKLFLYIYGFGSFFGSNYYVFAQFLNVIFWALGIFILYRLSIISGLSGNISAAFLCAVVLLPFSAYTKYFMPESMYFFMFCFAVYALFFGFLRQNYIAILLSGLIVGAMYFVKPHSLFILIASIVYLFFFSTGKMRLRITGIFISGAILMMVLGQIFLLKSSCSSPFLCFYGGAANSLLGSAQSFQPVKLLSDLLHVGVGHSFFMFSVFGISFFIAIAVTFSRLHLLKNESLVSEPLKLLASYTVFLSIFLLLVSVLFSVLVGEVGRIHSRYYFFVYPLLLLIIFHIPTIRLTKIGVFVALVICFLAIISLIRIGNYSEILGIALVSDSPELGFAFISRYILYISAALILGTTVIVILNPSKYGWLVGAIMLISFLSTVDVFIKQKGIFRGTFTTGQEAITVEYIIGSGLMDRTLVVGENPDIVSKFLFFLSSMPNIDYLSSGNSVVGSLEKYPQSKWLVSLSEGYLYPDWTDCSSFGQKLTICSISNDWIGLEQ